MQNGLGSVLGAPLWKPRYIYYLCPKVSVELKRKKDIYTYHIAIHASLANVLEISRNFRNT